MVGREHAEQAGYLVFREEAGRVSEGQFFADREQADAAARGLLARGVAAIIVPAARVTADYVQRRLHPAD